MSSKQQGYKVVRTIHLTNVIEYPASAKLDEVQEMEVDRDGHDDLVELMLDANELKVDVKVERIT
jgi:hypothetical protein